MADNRAPIDQAERDRALNPICSFIVQAPAGAGKTGLLTKRYLRLLAQVESPESIVAITFTRKAAGEMRSRVLDALRQARFYAASEDAHRREIGELARQVLDRDRQQKWRLLANPGRLRIQTFDSLAAGLAGQMPLLSQFGASPQTVEDARHHYLEAALGTIEQLEGEEGDAAAIARLLSRLDNRVGTLQSLIAGMLGRRDQWLRHIVNPERRVREDIEGTLAEIVARALEELAGAIPLECRGELSALARYAADNLGPDSPIAACRDLSALPETDPQSLPRWRGLAALLLTEDGKWRKAVTKNTGFPTSDKEMKGRMLVLLEGLRTDQALRDKLAALASLPAPAYQDEEWKILDALFSVLRGAVAELKLVFQAHGEVDFAEISLAALHALGQRDAPSELLLKLDYRIQHLLVDEFQDTSINQFLLLEKLVSGWEQGDGRTLFLVGDPMQSIYRFREAEVGLFLKVIRQGIGGIRPEYLQLKVNFRSQEGIIDWANQTFPQVFPKQEEITLGAVPYAPSAAVKPALNGEAVQQHCLIGRDDRGEAEQIGQIVRLARADNPQGAQTIAILVSSRAHLAEVVHVLREQQVPFSAVDIDSLVNKPVVQDLLALTRALLHLADRISWLALLRAPYCGLTLGDMYRLTSDAPSEAVIDLLRQTDRAAALSEDGRSRLRRVMPILEAALAGRGRHPLRDWVEWTWTALGGPAATRDATALLDAEAYFQLLETLDAGNDLDDFSQLPQQVESLFAQPDSNAGNALQLMTIHSAKGLEFDIVILPGLGKQPSRDKSQLLYWLEQASEEQEGELLFGPIKAIGQKKDGETASYIKGLEAEKRKLETGRLLYVAATRAKKRLHLLGHAALNTGGGLIRPPINSLLCSLWPVVEEEYERRIDAGPDPIPEEVHEYGTRDYLPRPRLVADWSCPPPPTKVSQVKAVEPEMAAVEFDWASDLARHVGVVVHRLLEHLADSGAVEAGFEPPDRFDPIARQMLAGEGLSASELDQARQRVMEALDNTLSDERGRWILSGRHQAAHCEMGITTCVDGEFQHLVIDRTFIDEKGVRWVIDYKTSAHTGGDVEAFLDREQERYRSQLARYAAVFQKSEGRPVRMALYFPLLRGWREWAHTSPE